MVRYWRKLVSFEILFRGDGSEKRGGDKPATISMQPEDAKDIPRDSSGVRLRSGKR